MAKRKPSAPRNLRGQFVKGHSGNAGGRPKGAPARLQNESETVAVKRGSKVVKVAASALIMKNLMKAAINDNDTSAARLFLREERLRARQRDKASPSLTVRPRCREDTLYLEELLLHWGILKWTTEGHLVIPRGVFADLDRLFSKGVPSPAVWKAMQLAVETPRVLQSIYPRRRLTYRSVAEAGRARAAAIAKAFAAYDALIAETDAGRFTKPRRRR